MVRVIKVSEETIDQIFKDTIIDDYRRLRDETARLKNNNLRSFEIEDLINNIRWMDAYETIMTYYLTDYERSKIINEQPFVFEEIDNHDEEVDNE